MIVLETLLLFFLIISALCTVLIHRLLSAVILFMTYSSFMSIVWVLLRSADLAITEAAVGAGITSVLFFATLRGIDALEGVDQLERK